MNTSSSDWLRSVPDGWIVGQLGHRAEVQLGKMLDSSRIVGTHLRPYLRNIDVQWGSINVDDLPVMDFSPADQRKFALRDGDLLVCEGGEIGRVAIWPGGRATATIKRRCTACAQEKETIHVFFTGASQPPRRPGYSPNAQMRQRSNTCLPRSCVLTGSHFHLFETSMRLPSFLTAKRRVSTRWWRSSRHSWLSLKSVVKQPSRKLRCGTSLQAKPNLRYVADILPGFAFPSAAFSVDERDMRLLRGVNVHPGQVNWAETVRLKSSDANLFGRFRLDLDDVVVGMDRPWINGGLRVARIAADDIPSLLVQRVARIRCGPRLLPRYAEIVLRSREFWKHVEPDMTGVSVPHISDAQIGSFRVPMPSLIDQGEAGASRRARACHPKSTLTIVWSIHRASTRAPFRADHRRSDRRACGCRTRPCTRTQLDRAGNVLNPSEKQFEADIEAWLVGHGGYTSGSAVVFGPSSPDGFDAGLGLWPGVLSDFLRDSQPVEWQRLTKLHGAALVEEKTVKRVVAELDSRGTLDVLRHGVTDSGVKLRLAFFRPASGLNPEAADVTRQPADGDPAGAFLDQGPVALHRHGARGQRLAGRDRRVEGATQRPDCPRRDPQYENDRDPREPLLRWKHRALVHFALDPDLAFMTTRLAGAPRGSCRSTRPGDTALATRTTPAATRPPTCGRRCGRATRNGRAGAIRPSRQDQGQEDGQGARGPDLPALSPASCGHPHDGARPHPWGGAKLPGAAFRRVGKVELDRVARAPTCRAARRQRPPGVHLRRCHYRPPRARPAIAGEHLPVRAQAGCRPEDQRRQRAACRRAERRHADHHHHVAKVRLRDGPRDDARRPALCRDRR